MGGVRQIAVSGNWIAALKTDGSIVTWINGYNQNGCYYSQSCDYFTVVGPRSLSSGNVNDAIISIALSATDNGVQIIFPNQASFTYASDVHILALTQNGSVMAFGDPTYGENFVPVSASVGGIVGIACGKSHSVALWRYVRCAIIYLSPHFYLFIFT